MEQRSPTNKEIIDWMIAAATLGRFKGDKRDGQAPPIKVQNFTNEMIIRYAAKALRARLSRLPFAELRTEAIEAADYVKAQRERSFFEQSVAQKGDPVDVDEALIRPHPNPVGVGVRYARITPQQPREHTAMILIESSDQIVPE
jgi:hypothetical protein